MFSRLMPREGRFFDYFNEHAEQIVLGAHELRALMANVAELPERRRSIEKIEHRADKITHQTMQLLHHTFITPIDRDEIHQLITRMDDILDLVEDVSQCMFLYDIKAVTDEARKLADICVASTEKVKAAVALLSNLKNSEAKPRQRLSLSRRHECQWRRVADSGRRDQPAGAHCRGQHHP
jgi:uncharacterized protein Yka (UPF0111/DUF47 family)